MTTRITEVRARRIWDSRGRPTVEVDVTLADGTTGRGIAPAGASTGSHEAVELRDGGEAFGGYGVGRALSGITTEIAPALLGADAVDQQAVDDLLIALDGTHDKSRLGGNALIATSMAVLDAAARSARLPLWRYLAADAKITLPLPEIQIFGGGAHAGRRIDIQDLLVMPVGAHSIDEALAMVADVYRAAGELMADSGRRAGVADEGGWWPDFSSNEEALQLHDAQEHPRVRRADGVPAPRLLRPAPAGARGARRARAGAALRRGLQSRRGQPVHGARSCGEVPGRVGARALRRDHGAHALPPQGARRGRAHDPQRREGGGAGPHRDRGDRVHAHRGRRGRLRRLGPGAVGARDLRVRARPRTGALGRPRGRAPRDRRGRRREVRGDRHDPGEGVPGARLQPA